jgi:hypothetical protein
LALGNQIVVKIWKDQAFSIQICIAYCMHAVAHHGPSHNWQVNRCRNTPTFKKMAVWIMDHCFFWTILWFFGWINDDPKKTKKKLIFLRNFCVILVQLERN